MYKRLLGLLLTFTILVSLVPAQIFAAESNTVGTPSAINWNDVSQPTASISFKDVEPTDWFYNAVMYAQQNGIFGGTGNGNFSPNGTMTRAMYVTVLGRIAGVDVSTYKTSAFGDVKSDAWYAPYVQWAVEQGITSGTSNHTFAPDTAITREQMATLTLRFFEVFNIDYQQQASLNTKPKDLSQISPWAVDAIVKLWQAGLLTGDANGNFNPQSKATRAEAATFAMRSNEVVKAGANPGQEKPTPTPTPTLGGQNTGSGDGGGGSGGSGGTNTPSAYTITFVTNGGTAINSLTLQPGESLSNLPAPVKQGYIFQGWYKDSALTQPVMEGDTVAGDMTLYANYIGSPDLAVTSIPSVSVLDVAPTFTIDVIDATGKMTAAQVQAGMTFKSSANPAFAGIVVTGTNGHFTVKSAAQDGKFEEGHTYQLTLKDANLSYAGQDATTTIYVFAIAKQEVMNVPLNPDMIYLSFADVSNMMLDGADVNSPSIPVMTTTVGGSGANLSEANATNGTFEYDGSTVMQAGDTVAIYEGVRPDLRTVDNADDGSVAYVQITAISGHTYTYTHADSEKVLTKPDILPVSPTADTDGDPDNHSITVEHSTMNFSDPQFASFGLNELTVVNAGDFIGFIHGESGSRNGTVTYGRITSITQAAEMDIITFTDATQEQVTSALNVYQKQQLDGDQLLSAENVAKLEGDVKRQAIASGFVAEAADYLADLAIHTDSFKQQYDALAPMAAVSVGSKVEVENLTVVPSVGTTLKNISGKTSGVSVSLQVAADIVIHINDESDIVIHLTSTFVEEMYLDLGINGDTQGHWNEVCVFGICVPYWYTLEDYVITASLDAYTYTGINITAEIATVKPSKLGDVLKDWLLAKKDEKLEQLQDIAPQLKALIEGAQDTGLDAATLKDKYKKILENDTEWIPLINKELFSRSQRVIAGIVEVELTVNFVVSANVNLTVGIDFSYMSAKRYSATVRVFSFTGSSNTVSLPGDGNYNFKFYVLGTLGLRAGLQVELKAGIGSVKWDSIGISVEPGVYVKLWGYFYYELKKSGGEKTTATLGALYLELGMYVEAEVGAQLFDDFITADETLVEYEKPLLSAGDVTNVVDFAYPQSDISPVDITAFYLNPEYMYNQSQLSGNYMRMELMNIKTGETTKQLLDRHNFTITSNSSDFTYNMETNRIEISEELRTQKNKGFPVHATGSLTIKYNSGKLALAPTRTVPVTVDFKVNDTAFDLNPMNGSGSTITIKGQPGDPITAIPDPVYPGMIFDGWYTDMQSGTKFTLPTVMPTWAEIAKNHTTHFYAHWKPRTDTPYKVNYYLAKPVHDYHSYDLSQYTLMATETYKGTTYTKVSLPSDINNRFTAQKYSCLNCGVTLSSSMINNDGSTNVNILYVPITVKMNFNQGYGPNNGAFNTLSLESKSAFTWKMPVMSRPGYTFAGWSPAIPSTVPDQDTTYTAQWKARDDVHYTVVHLKQDTSKTTVEGYWVTNTYPELVRDPVTNNYVWKSKVPALADTYTVADVEDHIGSTDAVTNAVTPKDYEGFTFDSNVQGTVKSSTIAADGTTVLKLYYKRNTYTATFDPNGGSGSVSALTVPYGVSIPMPSVTKENYSLTWSPAVPAAMPAHDISFTAQWDSNMEYKVTHYRPDLTGKYTIVETETLRGPIGATATATSKSYEGFTYDNTVSGTVASGTIVNSTSNQLQLKLYYKRNIYQLKFAPNGGTFSGIFSGTGTVSYGFPYEGTIGNSFLSLFSIKKTGSVFAGWSPAIPATMPAQDITVTAQWTSDTTISKVSIDNTTPAVGDTLNAAVTMGDTGAAGARVTYQWKVETATAGTFTNATGTGNATASYTVAAADMGKKLQVVVTGVSPITGSVTATTDTVSVPITDVTIDNPEPAVGDTVTAIVAMGNGSEASSQVTYQWQVETTAGSGTYTKAAGNGSTGASYTVAAADAGKQLQVVVSYMGRSAGAVTSGPTSAVVVYVTGVTIDNTSPHVGDTLTATVTMGDGKSAGNRVSYEWLVEDIVGSNIYVAATGTGKTTSSYTVAEADLGKKLKVLVYGANGGVGSEFSGETDAVQAAVPTSDPLPDWITSANGLDLDSATVTVVSSTEVSISGSVTLTDSWILPEGVTLNLNNTELNMSDAGLNLVTLTISAGTTLNLSNSMVKGGIETVAGATLNVSNTTLDEGYSLNILAGATLNVSGTVTLAMASTLIVDGTFHIASLATVINNGTITGYDSTGVITNNGTLTNNESITNMGTITNTGTIVNAVNMGMIMNAGTMTNTGTITNNGTIVNIDMGNGVGTITNNGTITGNNPIT